MCPDRALVQGALLLLVMAAAGEGRAQPLEPLGVDVTVSAPAMTRPWGAQLQPIVDGIKAVLVPDLNAALPYWQFAPAPAPGPVKVILSVKEPYPQSLALVLELQPVAGGPAVSVVSEDWMGQADLILQGYPPASAAVKEITTAFRERLLKKHEATIRTRLTDWIPLALGAELLPGSAPFAGPRIVLPLPRSRFANLRESVFRLSCDWPSYGKADLESSARGLYASYRPDPAAPPYDALVVVPETRVAGTQRTSVENVMTDLATVRFQWVFLRDYRQPSDWLLGGQP
jgi:hypothetical protein